MSSPSCLSPAQTTLAGLPARRSRVLSPPGPVAQAGSGSASGCSPGSGQGGGAWGPSPLNLPPLDLPPLVSRTQLAAPDVMSQGQGNRGRAASPTTAATPGSDSDNSQDSGSRAQYSRRGGRASRKSEARQDRGVNAVGGGLLTELCPMPPLGLLTQLTPGPVKSCHCKKSQCLKLYCDCFAAGVFCSNCACLSCLNSQDHAERVEEKRRCIMLRDPEAFTRKIMADSQAGSERHKRGCNCKRSHCLKKYCECFQAAVKCSATCKCLDCQNQADPEPEPPRRPFKRQPPAAAPPSLPSRSSRSAQAARQQQQQQQQWQWQGDSGNPLAYLPDPLPGLPGLCLPLPLQLEARGGEGAQPAWQQGGEQWAAQDPGPLGSSQRLEGGGLKEGGAAGGVQGARAALPDGSWESLLATGRPPTNPRTASSPMPSPALLFEQLGQFGQLGQLVKTPPGGLLTAERLLRCGSDAPATIAYPPGIQATQPTQPHQLSADQLTDPDQVKAAVQLSLEAGQLLSCGSTSGAAKAEWLGQLGWGAHQPLVADLLATLSKLPSQGQAGQQATRALQLLSPPTRPAAPGKAGDDVNPTPATPDPNNTQVAGGGDKPLAGQQEQGQEQQQQEGGGAATPSVMETPRAFLADLLPLDSASSHHQLLQPGQLPASFLPSDLDSLGALSSLWDSPMAAGPLGSVTGGPHTFSLCDLLQTARALTPRSGPWGGLGGGLLLSPLSARVTSLLTPRGPPDLALREACRGGLAAGAEGQGGDLQQQQGGKQEEGAQQQEQGGGATHTHASSEVKEAAAGGAAGAGAGGEESWSEGPAAGTGPTGRAADSRAALTSWLHEPLGSLPPPLRTPTSLPACLQATWQLLLSPHAPRPSPQPRSASHPHSQASPPSLAAAPGPAPGAPGAPSQEEPPSQQQQQQQQHPPPSEGQAAAPSQHPPSPCPSSSALPKRMSAPTGRMTAAGAGGPRAGGGGPGSPLGLQALLSLVTPVRTTRTPLSRQTSLPATLADLTHPGPSAPAPAAHLSLPPGLPTSRADPGSAAPPPSAGLPPTGASRAASAGGPVELTQPAVGAAASSAAHASLAAPARSHSHEASPPLMGSDHDLGLGGLLLLSGEPRGHLLSLPSPRKGLGQGLGGGLTLPSPFWAGLGGLGAPSPQAMLSASPRLDALAALAAWEADGLQQQQQEQEAMEACRLQPPQQLAGGGLGQGRGLVDPDPPLPPPLPVSLLLQPAGSQCGAKRGADVAAAALQGDSKRARPPSPGLQAAAAAAAEQGPQANPDGLQGGAGGPGPESQVTVGGGPGAPPPPPPSQGASQLVGASGPRGGAGGVAQALPPGSPRGADDPPSSQLCQPSVSGSESRATSQAGCLAAAAGPALVQASAGGPGRSSGSSGRAAAAQKVNALSWMRGRLHKPPPMSFPAPSGPHSSHALPHSSGMWSQAQGPMPGLSSSQVGRPADLGHVGRLGAAAPPHPFKAAATAAATSAMAAAVAAAAASLQRAPSPAHNLLPTVGAVAVGRKRGPQEGEGAGAGGERGASGPPLAARGRAPSLPSDLTQPPPSSMAAASQPAALPWPQQQQAGEAAAPLRPQPSDLSLNPITHPLQQQQLSSKQLMDSEAHSQSQHSVPLPSTTLVLPSPPPSHHNHFNHPNCYGELDGEGGTLSPLSLALGCNVAAFLQSPQAATPLYPRGPFTTFSPASPLLRAHSPGHPSRCSLLALGTSPSPGPVEAVVVPQGQGQGLRGLGFCPQGQQRGAPPAASGQWPGAGGCLQPGLAVPELDSCPPHLKLPHSPLAATSLQAA